LLEEYNRILNEIEENKVTQIKSIRDDISEEEARQGAIAERERENTSRSSNAPPPPPRTEGIQTISDEIAFDEVIEVEEIESSRRLEREAPISAYASDSPQEKTQKYRGKLVVKDRYITTPYLKELREVKNVDKAYEYYLIQRISYKDVPSYYIDVANFFIDSFNHTEYARRIVSNIPEIDGDNYELLKVFAYQMQVEEAHNIASFIFERILELRPEDSQSYRDLALAYENIGKCQEALDLLTSITNGSIYENNHRRVFNGVKTISENEIKQ